MRAIFVVLWALWGAAGFFAFRVTVGGEGERYPSTDWVEWRDGAEGVEARNVLTVAANNPFLKDEYVRPGDKLVAIDAVKIQRAAVADFYVASQEPGAVSLYQVKRKSIDFSGETLHSFFVAGGYRPAFLFARHASVWNFYVWAAGVAFLSVAFLGVLLYPFIKANFKEATPLMGVTLMLILLYGGQILRRFILSIDYRFKLIEIEKLGVFFYAAIAVGVALLYAFQETDGGRKKRQMIPGALVGTGFLAYLGYALFYAPTFRFPENWFENGLTAFIFLHLLLVAFNAYRKAPVSPAKKTAFGFSLAASCLFAYQLFLWYLNENFVWTNLTAHFALAAPAFLYSRSVFVFGGVSAAAVRTVTYLVFTVLALTFFFLFQNLLSPLITDDTYRGLAILTLTAGLIALSWRLFLRNRPRFQKYFALESDRKRRKIQSFIEQIPRYAHSDALDKDALHEINAFLAVEKVDIWRADEEKYGIDFDSLYKRLAGRYWTRDHEISQAELSEEDFAAVKASDLYGLFPVRILNDKNAILTIGRKKKGVFTLEEVEILKNLMGQYGLTLEILRLLEKEKVLVEKTMEAQLIALRSQINPHFLFNTLNSISDLVHYNPAQAEAALEKLAYILRYSLRFSHHNFVSIENEMSLVRSYLDIEQIRFGDRLRINIDLPEDCLAAELPAYVLQTIVENSIKHGVLKLIEGGLLEMRFRRTETEVLAEIYDNGPGVDPERIFKGTGLKNIITRIETLYGSQKYIQFENTGSGTMVTLRIPLKT